MRKRVTFEAQQWDGSWLSVAEVVDYLVLDGRVLTLIDVMPRGTVRSRFYRGIRNLIIVQVAEERHKMNEHQYLCHVGNAMVA